MNLRLTISYAGSVEQAMMGIRSARKLLNEGADIEALLNHLCEHTREGECDYIVSSHMCGAELRVIKQGSVSGKVEDCWIGDVAGFDALAGVPQREMQGHEHVSAEEMKFVSAFQEIFVTRTKVSDTIGGIPVLQISTPVGHTYMSYGWGYVGGTITIGPTGVPPEQAAARIAEQHDYKVTVIAPLERGAAVLAAFFEQAGVAFIYSPLEADEVVKLNETSVDATLREVRRRARLLGGVVVD